MTQFDRNTYLSGARRRQSARADDPGKNEGGFSPTQVLTAVVALFVAALAAVGVTGDILTRAVRNYPIAISALLIVTLLATLGFFTVDLSESRSGDRKKVLRGRHVMGIVASICATILLGALSVADREQPGIALQATYSGGQVTLTVESNAAGLATKDQLSVQVLGLSKFSVIDRTTAEICEQIYAHSIRAGSGDNLQDFLNSRHDKYQGTVSILLSERLGPDSTGTIKSITKLDFPAGLYQGVCAFSPLPNEQIESARNSASYLRLSNCNETSTTPSTTSTSSTGVHTDPAPPPPPTVTVTTTASPSWAWNQTANCSSALSGTSPPSTPATHP